MRASILSSVLPSAEAHGNAIRELWNRVHRLPGGTRLFSELVGRFAPYTGTIRGHVVELSPGYAKVLMKDRPELRNHLRSVHAIALANLGELAGNIAVAYSLPDDARFIVGGLSIDYLKKARGTLTAESRPALPAVIESNVEVPVVVEIRDAKGDLTTRVTLRTVLGKKKAR